MSQHSHRHALLMMEYARVSLNTETPWDFFQEQVMDEWFDCLKAVTFDPTKNYRYKPRTVKIGEFDIPEPEREPLAYGDKYFVPRLTALTLVSEALIWTGSKVDCEYLNRGFVHLSAESAELHSRALIILTSIN